MLYVIMFDVCIWYHIIWSTCIWYGHINILVAQQTNLID